MRILRSLWRRLRGTFRRGVEDADFTAELEGHLQLQIDDNIRSGMTPEEARRQALIKFGSITSLQESYRDQLGFPLLESLLNDLRFSFRMIAKSPGLTAIVVLTLALGIGVNTAIFSVLNGWLFRPLPVSHPEELMVIAPFRQQGPNAKMSYADLKDYQQQGDTFSGMLAYSMGAAGLSADGTPHEFVYSAVTGNFFSMLGVQPALGRFFLPGEGEHPGDELRVVLGYAYWKKHFDGNPAVLGKKVQVNGNPATVIGVAPPSFHGLLFAFDMDGYLPLSFMSRGQETHDFYSNRDNRGLSVVGRLKPNVSTEQAYSSLELISKRLAAQYPDSDSGYSIRIIPERLARPAPLVASFAPAIATLFLGLAMVVLLIACTNVAGLLLARATSQQREMAIRAALGASQWRLVSLALGESFLLAALGGIAGVLLGKLAITASGYLLHPVTTTANFGYRMDCSFDWKVFAYTFTIVIFTGLFVALLPALRAGRIQINAILQKYGHGGNFGRQRFRTISVVTQLAGCVMLLIVSGLFVRTLRHAETMSLGFDPDHVLTVLLDPRQIGFDDARTHSFYRDVTERIGALPGVESVGLASAVPMEIPSAPIQVFVEGRPYDDKQKAPAIPYNAIGTTYLETMRVPVVQGRGFTEADTESAPRIAIVNQVMAQQLWPNENPIGKRFSTKDSSGPFIEVVGVAANGQYMFVSPEPQRYFYVPWNQKPSSLTGLQVRTSLPPEELIPIVQREILKVAPGLPIIDGRTMDDIVHGLGGLFIFRLAAILSAVLGLLGLTLGVVGVYGVVSCLAAERIHEIGIRIALGADREDILRMVCRQGLWIALAGVSVGLFLSLTLTRAMHKLLIGVSPSDPITYVTTISLISAVTLIACWIPASRATRVDPMVVLRCE